MNEEKRRSLAESDKGSYYQEWSSDTPEEQASCGASRQKLLGMEERGSVKIWADLDNTSTGDSDSSDDCEEDDDAVGSTFSMRSFSRMP